MASGKRNPHPLAPTDLAMNKVPVDRPKVAEAQRGAMVAKKGPTGGPEPFTASHPRQVLERMGARRRIDVKLPGPQSPEATATQANGKTMPSVMGQSRNFWGGESTSR